MRGKHGVWGKMEEGEIQKGDGRVFYYHRVQSGEGRRPKGKGVSGGKRNISFPLLCSQVGRARRKETHTVRRIWSGPDPARHQELSKGGRKKSTRCLCGRLADGGSRGEGGKRGGNDDQFLTA